MITSNFKRVEKKYILEPEQRKKMLANIDQYMEPDKYKTSQVYSIYLDDESRSIISRSIEKPLYKEKVRIRSYNSLSDDTPVFIELKKKFKGIVYKRRIKMSSKGAQLFISGYGYEQAIKKFPLTNQNLEKSNFGCDDCQIASEIEAFLKRHNYPKESMLIHSTREAYVSKKMTGLP